ncbi:4-hydroxythreonine-4-phosphate dehydrogenase PdxA [Myroides odoratimimus]|uniref:4-hydroxythreonine-4-phosphate dehydrogenase PdxA n=1 Tax=Myroides odoratimimus TaxID=76832 RepID=UPI00217F3F6C|nr:4-hydroxythreonine-4-phosphate dehydrogenase PdxA [Myroides odoratimimus]MCS7474359.1 4-hydroxythreonine-4-phosphate dehydrogenase PdxA [Myroides odoratimimus]MDM1413887.1 4-hydroxythreonine-4-phosphate dehydrogenase PdxA [Myroides odoratimimus]MDM1446135.1 4-hydroxythreonine-4-phosphate dehydrogenase PdxA [Myroides odoratimimus]MDM1508421.1 4-hydroxythreonine-4-phosphate dehydrogenase PdxA [Myroides odoratimimus]MDM1518970.1 4-hydroxythreonine-4-phosphate dehydrogenase PdxA [Myroides odora
MSHKEEIIKVGISIGDLNGIGSEVILKCFEDSRMLEICTPVIFGNSKPLSYIKKTIDNNTPIQGIDNLSQIVPNRLNVLNLWKENVNISFGKNDPIVGKYAIKSFVAATEALKNGEIDVLVTAPINKYNSVDEEFKYPGHTDYLNEQLEGQALMLLVSEDLKIGLLTDHLPIQDVAKAITPELIEQKVKTINNTLIQDFNIFKPRIAILGLNPHAGDGGVIGNEELTIIKPTVEKLNEEGILISGPFPADGFFGSGTYKHFDAVIACYHDQGLAPFKAISFGHGVNYTAGLDKIRTSPDHGTAYEIAGKGIADETSFKEALYLAIDIYNNRTRNIEAAANPLQPQEKDFSTKKFDN